MFNEVKFWSRVVKSADCWEWLGPHTNRGYGSLQIDGKSIGVHRVMWELMHKAVVPKGMVVLHKCNNRGCVNPAHLSIGTYKENALYSVASGTHAQAEKTHCPAGHEYTPETTGGGGGVGTKRYCKLCHTARQKKICERSREFARIYSEKK